MALYWDLSKIKDYEKECFLGEGDNRTLKPGMKRLDRIHRENVLRRS